MDAAPEKPPADRDLYCPHCGYNLRGLPGDPIRCPECGEATGVADLLLPAPTIRAAYKLIESGPAYAVGAVVLLGFLGVLTVFEAAFCFPGMLLAVLGWCIAVQRFRKSCRGRPGWVGALFNYHVCGLTMLAGVIGGAPLFCWVVHETAGWIGFSSEGILLLALIGYIVLVWAPVRWLYGQAIAPLEALQREVAIEIAREMQRKWIQAREDRGYIGRV